MLLLWGIPGAVYAQPENITVKGNAVTSQGLGGLYQVIVQVPVLAPSVMTAELVAPAAGVLTDATPEHDEPAVAVNVPV